MGNIGELRGREVGDDEEKEARRILAGDKLPLEKIRADELSSRIVAAVSGGGHFSGSNPAAGQPVTLASRWTRITASLDHPLGKPPFDTVMLYVVSPKGEILLARPFALCRRHNRALWQRGNSPSRRACRDAHFLV